MTCLLLKNFCQSAKRVDVHQCSFIALHRFQHKNLSTDLQIKDPELGFLRAAKYPTRVALQDIRGRYTYGDLITRSGNISMQIRKILGSTGQQERIAFLCPNDVSYVISQWGIWMSGHIAVPLSPLHPTPMLDYMMKDSKSSLLISTPSTIEKVESLLKEGEVKLMMIGDEDVPHACLLPESDWMHPEDFYWRNLAMIVYTSGTTGKPKGAVLSHRNLYAMVHNMVTAWEWSESDNILHVLPLHHIHGIINALMCPLQVGAKCVMLPHFDAAEVWRQLLSLKTTTQDRITVFTAVPTIYSLLLQEHRKRFDGKDRAQEYVRAICQQKIRLMMSGSAALPTPFFDEWHHVTGHYLLERYGMTEIGMALSNPLDGERRPGFVGNPLPTVQVRIASFEGKHAAYDTMAEGTWDGTKETVGQEGKSGELLVSGPSVFEGYWNRKKETINAFTSDGWFKTGDTVQYQNGAYKILGRSSVDIIKTGGYKVSALEIEAVLLTHPAVKDCAVIGLPDITWGEKVTAVVVLEPDKKLTLKEASECVRSKMPPYAAPTELREVKELPKNAMGKVNKKVLQEEFKS